MSYVSYVEMLDLIGQDEMIIQTDRDNTGDPVPSVAEDALRDASNTVDAYLVRYSLPLGKTPDVLRRPVVDIAVYYLASNHARLTDDIKDRYAAALKFLDRLSSGKANLGADEPATEKPDGADGSDEVLFAAPEERMMTRKNLSGM